MRQVMLMAMPKGMPGITVADMNKRIVPELPESVFPGGAKAGWWIKCVQLDLEARGQIARQPTKPLRFHKTA